MVRSLAIVSLVCAFGGAIARAQDQAAPSLRNQYRIAPGDELSIMVYRNPELSFPKVLIPPSGQLAFPLLGRIDVQGKTIEELEAELVRRYSGEYITAPQIAINLVTLNSMSVFVLGEVRNPGIYPVLQARTLVAAVSAAGGLTPDAQRGKIYLIHKRVGDTLQYQRYDLSASAQIRRPDANPEMQSGDMVIVPPSKLAGTTKFFAALGVFVRPVADLALIERVFVSGGK